MTKIRVGQVKSESAAAGHIPSSDGAGNVVWEIEAPINAKYIVSAANDNLSAEVVIPGLAGSADILGVGGSSFNIEFDSAADLPTWTPSAPSVVDSDTTVKSHLYVKTTDNTVRYGLWDWAPAGNFDVRMSLPGVGLESYTSTPDVIIALVIANSDNSLIVINRFLWHTYTSGGSLPQHQNSAYSFSGGAWTLRSNYTYAYFTPPIYLRITRTGNIIKFFISCSGLPGTWLLTGSVAFDIVVAKVGLQFFADIGTIIADGVIDWIRASE